MLAKLLDKQPSRRGRASDDHHSRGSYSSFRLRPRGTRCGSPRPG
jgi:hypothetical protein